MAVKFKISFLCLNKDRFRYIKGDMICPECNYPNMANANFCVNCGGWLNNRMPDERSNPAACRDYKFLDLFTNLWPPGMARQKMVFSMAGTPYLRAASRISGAFERGKARANRGPYQKTVQDTGILFCNVLWDANIPQPFSPTIPVYPFLLTVISWVAPFRMIRQGIDEVPDIGM